MARTTTILHIDSIDQMPEVEVIRGLSRDIVLMLVFAEAVAGEREAIGRRLKQELTGFQVGIHMLEPQINIARLITDAEIEEHACMRRMKTGGGFLIRCLYWGSLRRSGRNLVRTV